MPRASCPASTVKNFAFLRPLHCITTVNLQCMGLYPLYTHCKPTVNSGLHSFQGYTVFKFYPLSLRYRDPAASPLNARQYMFENQAIKLINRQLSWLTGSLTCLRAFTRFYALLRAFTQFSKLSSLQFTPFTVYSVNNLNASSIKLALLLAFTGS